MTERASFPQDQYEITKFELQLVSGAGHSPKKLGTTWIIEEASGHLRYQGKKGPAAQLYLYKLSGDILSLAGTADLGVNVKRPELVISMLERAKATEGTVVCSFRSAPTTRLAELLDNFRGLKYVLEVNPTRALQFERARDGVKIIPPKLRAERAAWAAIKLQRPNGSTNCFVANLGKVQFGNSGQSTCFALSFGRITSYQRGVLIGITSVTPADKLKDLAQLLAWTRWIRLAVRRVVRDGSPSSEKKGASVSGERTQGQPLIKVRANRRLASAHDIRSAQQRASWQELGGSLRGMLTEGRDTLNVVELFAGAGGMGIGFLNARSAEGKRYRVTGSAEIHPIYTQTLLRNHRYMESNGLVPRGSTPKDCVPTDLCKPIARAHLADMSTQLGDVDIVIGGPPCQGFSSANRNSWSSSNPNNRLVDAFMDCVSLMRPKVLLMENVQGILWTPRDGTGASPSVATHVLNRFKRMGYHVFPKLLDAVWYGAPQNRNRFFLLGLHRDLGYRKEDFGEWGPFPIPTHGPGTGVDFVTVKDAISDLPMLSNGHDALECPYKDNVDRLNSNKFLRSMRKGAPEGVIWDHITSRHSDYVIERYKQIPAGKNWEAVRHLMTNYADVDRTHSNIYRRLAWNEPSITMGHYRKSMIIHPSQDRGLSLREAARLQTFPDWFRFAGSNEGVSQGGLIHKQQQLANAVCPNVTKAVAEFLLRL